MAHTHRFWSTEDRPYNRNLSVELPNPDDPEAGSGIVTDRLDGETPETAALCGYEQLRIALTLEYQNN